MLAQLLCAVLCAATLDASPADASPGAAPADTTITLARPSVVAFFGVSSAQLEQQPELITVLSDFQYSMQRARRGLDSLSVEAHEAYGPDVTLRTPTGDVALPLGGRLPIGYYFWAPGKPAFLCRGVRVEQDLVADAKNFLEFVRTGDDVALARCERLP